MAKTERSPSLKAQNSKAIWLLVAADVVTVTRSDRFRIYPSISHGARPFSIHQRNLACCYRPAYRGFSKRLAFLGRQGIDCLLANQKCIARTPRI